MENLFNSPSIERKAIAIGAIHGNRIHGNRIVGESVRSGKFAKRWKRIHPRMDAEGGEGQTIERRTHTANGITARMAVGRQWRAASKTRIERRDKPNKTEPSLESTKPNPSKERERWRGGSEGLAKRQTYLIQVGWSQWRQEEAGARRGEKRIEGRVWYSLDGPRKKIYLASLFDVEALFNYSGRKTWRERLFNQRFERVEA